MKKLMIYILLTLAIACGISNTSPYPIQDMTSIVRDQAERDFPPANEARIIPIEGKEYMFFDLKLMCICWWIDNKCVPPIVLRDRPNTYTNSFCNIHAIEYTAPPNDPETSSWYYYCGGTSPNEGVTNYYRWNAFSSGNLWTLTGEGRCVLKYPVQNYLYLSEPIKINLTEFATK